MFLQNCEFWLTNDQKLHDTISSNSTDGRYTIKFAAHNAATKRQEIVPLQYHLKNFMYNSLRGGHSVHNINIYKGIIIYGLRANGDKSPSPSHLSKEKGKLSPICFCFM